jgi:DNA-binding Lrp family transcriptional regulator
LEPGGLEVYDKMPKVIAYVLALASAGSEHDVAEQIKKIEDVTDAKVCYGAWDIVVSVQTENFGKLDAVVTKIRKLPNIEQTTTLVAT